MLRKLFAPRRNVGAAAHLMVLLLAVGSPLRANEEAAGTEKAAVPVAGELIQQLIDQLAADSYVEREQAQRKLMELGIVARPYLEKALQSDDIEQKLRAEVILQELRREELWRPTLVTLEQRQMPVLAAFREIARQTGNPVNWDLTPKSLNRLIDVDLQEQTYWQAMDYVSRHCDVIPRFYDDPKRAGVVLTHGYLGVGPVDYSGPLRGSLLYARHMATETLNFADGVPDSQESLEMTMALHWEQQFPLCRYGQPIVVEALTDSGEDLTIQSKRPDNLMHVSRRQRQLVYSFRLKPPQRHPAGKLKSLRVSLSLAAAGDFTCLELATLQPTRVEQHGYMLELVDCTTDDKSTLLTLLWTRPYRYDKMNATDMADEFVEVVDSQGQRLPFHQQKVLGNQVQAQFTLQVPVKSGKPSGVRYHAATLKSQKTVEFHFQDVPLPSTIR